MYEAGKNKKRAVTLGNLVQRTDCPSQSAALLGAIVYPDGQFSGGKGASEKRKAAESRAEEK